MLQLNLRDNNNFTHLAGILSEGLSHGEDASKIYTLETYRYYGLSPRKQREYILSSTAPQIISGGSTLTNLSDPSEYKPHLNIQKQQRSLPGNSQLRVPTTSIYDRQNTITKFNGREN